MADEVTIATAPAVSAKTLHPETQVVTVNAHERIVAECEALINSILTDIKVFPLQISVASGLAFAAGLLLGLAL